RAAAAGGSRRGRTGGVRPRSVLAATAQADGGEQAGGAAEQGEAGGLGDGDDLHGVEQAVKRAGTLGGDVQCFTQGGDGHGELHVVAARGVAAVVNPRGGFAGVVGRERRGVGRVASGDEVEVARGGTDARVEGLGVIRGPCVVGVAAGN